MTNIIHERVRKCFIFPFEFFFFLMKLSHIRCCLPFGFVVCNAKMKSNQYRNYGTYCQTDPSRIAFIVIGGLLCTVGPFTPKNRKLHDVVSTDSRLQRYCFQGIPRIQAWVQHQPRPLVKIEISSFRSLVCYPVTNFVAFYMFYLETRHTNHFLNNRIFTLTFVSRKFEHTQTYIYT